MVKFILEELVVISSVKEFQLFTDFKDPSPCLENPAMILILST
jgi:hypothetical protein